MKYKNARPGLRVVVKATGERGKIHAVDSPPDTIPILVNLESAGGGCRWFAPRELMKESKYDERNPR